MQWCNIIQSTERECNNSVWKYDFVCTIDLDIFGGRMFRGLITESFLASKILNLGYLCVLQASWKEGTAPKYFISEVINL